MDEAWLPGGRPDPHAEVRLFCIPHLGGSAVLFRRWPQHAPRGLAVCPVELPGRARRLMEPAFTRMPALVTALADALDPLLDRPFALFGHSLGGLIGFELARTLHERGRPAPVHLFVAAISAPGTAPVRPFVHDAPDHELLEELRVLGGTPPELLADAEVMNLMMPTLRADFAVLETYRRLDAPAVDVPITVFGGDDDFVASLPSLRAWDSHTTKGSRVRMFPGDHFFPAVEVAGLVREISRDLLAPDIGMGSI